MRFFLVSLFLPLLLECSAEIILNCRVKTKRLDATQETFVIVPLLITYLIKSVFLEEGKWIIKIAMIFKVLFCCLILKKLEV